jgi:hypothetical protein
MFYINLNPNIKFNAGEIVKVKSRDYITKSINLSNKLNGCLFMEQMLDYCGNKYEVLKIVKSFFNEHQMRTFKPRTPLYILNNLICEGRVKNFSYMCDRSCFLLWHGDWLEKI